jgi:hypothetical protein
MQKTRLIVLSAVWLFFVVPGASAADADLQPATPTIADNLDNLSYAVLRRDVPDPSCPKVFTSISVTYPFSTGVAAADALLREEAVGIFTSALNDNPEIDAESCSLATGDRGTEVFSNFIASSTTPTPWPSHLSILTETFYFSYGAAHPSTGHRAVNIDLAKGKIMDLADVFPDVSSAMPKLWANLVRRWCEVYDFEEMPYYYRMDDQYTCSSQRIPLPAAMTAERPAFEAIGIAALNSEGMTVTLGEYGGRSRIDGFPFITLPKNFLISIGADPAIWR